MVLRDGKMSEHDHYPYRSTTGGDEFLTPVTSGTYTGMLIVPSATPSAGDLTQEEQRIIDCLVDAWNRFVELPVLGQWHSHEFMHVIHQAQRLVLSRPAIRKQPKLDKLIEID